MFCIKTNALLSLSFRKMLKNKCNRCTKGVKSPLLPPFFFFKRVPQDSLSPSAEIMEKSTILVPIGGMHLRIFMVVMFTCFPPSQRRRKEVLKDSHAAINYALFAVANNLVFSLCLHAFLYQSSPLTQLVPFLVCSWRPKANRTVQGWISSMQCF